MSSPNSNMTATTVVGLYDNYITVGKPRTDSVPPTMQSQIPKSREVTLFF